MGAGQLAGASDALARRDSPAAGLAPHHLRRLEALTCGKMGVLAQEMHGGGIRDPELGDGRPSPSVPSTKPHSESIASSSRRLWSASTAFQASPSFLASRVEPSMSVNNSAIVPSGGWLARTDQA